MRRIWPHSKLPIPTAAIALGLLGALGSGCPVDTSTALGIPEICDNAVDDDEDGLADCADPDCAGHLACDPRYVELLCDNQVDDDGDGQVDCDDPDCTTRQACNLFQEVDCADGVDNDGDSLVDCRDPDCAEAGNCLEHCSDEVDNDGDGLVDCLDPDCAGEAVCLHERCGNGLDDDGDTLVDCEDPDCADFEGCETTPPLELCDDSVDNDGDGKTDCQDPDCSTSPYCVEVFCNDGWDNDQNGLVDCEDPACLSTPACQVNANCLGATPLYCGIPVLDTTRGRVSSFTTDPCTQIGSLLGGERLYKFTNTSNLTMTLQLRVEPVTPNTNFMLLVFGGTASGCTQTTTCIPTASKTELEAVLSLDPGHTIYAAVDSVEPQGGEFMLLVLCPEPSTENCVNGEDDDGDNAVDCWDPDCLGMPGCLYWVSAGIGCVPGDPTLPCAPGERCQPVTIANNSTTNGICTKTCYHPGMPGTDCYNQDFPLGECIATALPESSCVMRCGTQFGTPNACPMGTICTNPSTGSTSTVQSGICAPY